MAQLDTSCSLIMTSQLSSPWTISVPLGNDYSFILGLLTVASCAAFAESRLSAYTSGRLFRKCSPEDLQVVQLREDCFRHNGLIPHGFKDLNWTAKIYFTNPSADALNSDTEQLGFYVYIPPTGSGTYVYSADIVNTPTGDGNCTAKNRLEMDGVGPQSKTGSSFLCDSPHYGTNEGSN